MHRFFISPEQVSGLIVRFDDDQAHQIERVLRLRPGDRVLALDGAGQEFEIVLEEIARSRVSGLIARQSAAGGEPAVQLTLYQSMLKREKFEWVLQKGTEIGVSEFVPVITNRSLVREADVKPDKLERWRRIIKEAAEQSGRGVLPRLISPVPFMVAAAEGLSYDCTLMAWENAAEPNIRTALQRHGSPHNIGLYIGPEGGFDQAEIEEAAFYGITSVTLGRRILRTETAAIVAAAIVLHELGEMG